VRIKLRRYGQMAEVVDGLAQRVAVAPFRFLCPR
jgi:hypothetical protein